MRLLQQSSTAQPLTFLLVDETDHVTPETGLTPTVTISKNGASFASPAGSVSEIGNGWYQVAGNATDTGTLGSIILHATATGADPTDREYSVVAFDPLTASLGLNNLSAAQVNAECDTALADYDAPTNAEMVARTLAAADYTTAAALTTAQDAINILPTVADLSSALDIQLLSITGHTDAIQVQTTDILSLVEAAGIRAALGMASANLDDQLLDLSTEVGKIPRAGFATRWTNAGTGADYDDIEIAAAP